VVEDEFFSRWHAVELVEAAGYRAVEASNADEAIAVLQARKDIRIVFTDINMPGSMDGLKLARAIRDRWPPIELILTSGHFDVPERDIPERGLFFPKPYRDEEIVAALHKFAPKIWAFAVDPEGRPPKPEEAGEPSGARMIGIKGKVKEQLGKRRKVPRSSRNERA
jgi:CheY-like chemotaxis protein